MRHKRGEGGLKMDTEKITDFGLSGHPGNNRPDIGSWGGDKRERERMSKRV